MLVVNTCSLILQNSQIPGSAKQSFLGIDSPKTTAGGDCEFYLFPNV